MPTQVSLNFTREELQCKCGCGQMLIPQSSIDRLQRLRTRFGKPLPITSGYRCPEYNNKVSKTGLNGPHTKAAFDIGLQGVQALTLVTMAVLEGFTGIGINQKGTDRFIHIDDLPDEPKQPRPWLWSY